MIKHMKPLGFSLEEMRGLLETRDGLERDDLDPPTRLHLHGQLHMYGSAAQQKYTALREQLAIAENFVQRLGQDVERHRD